MTAHGDLVYPQATSPNTTLADRARGANGERRLLVRADSPVLARHLAGPWEWARLPAAMMRARWEKAWDVADEPADCGVVSSVSRPTSLVSPRTLMHIRPIDKREAWS